MTDRTDDNLNALLLEADVAPRSGASGRLTQSFATAFAAERKRERIRRFAAVAAVASLAAACVAVGLIVSRQPSSDTPAPPVALETAPMPSPVVTVVPGVQGDREDSSLSVAVSTSREPTAFELAVLRAADARRVAARSTGDSPTRDTLAVEPHEPITADAAPKASTNPPADAPARSPVATESIDAEAILRTALRAGQRERREAVALLAGHTSPSVAGQLASLVDVPALRRDAVRALLSRTDEPSRELASQLAHRPASSALVRSVRSELAARPAPQSPPDPPVVPAPQNILPSLLVRSSFLGDSL